GRCHQELAAFRALLECKKELEENADIKPFFESAPHLSVYLGNLTWNFAHYELLAYQYQLFGDYNCDLVVGDSVNHSFLFTEWEDATVASLFRQQGKKATPEWSPRFEHGYSQLIDW